MITMIWESPIFSRTATWGGPPGPRPTPSSAFLVVMEPDHGVRRGRGRPPHCLMCLVFLAFQLNGFAATVNGRVELMLSHDPNVRKHRDFSGVVVWLEPTAGAPVMPVKTSHAQMIQRDKTFSPHVLPVLAGTVVNFPNYDPIFHNAFSNYDGQVFDIGLY